MKVLCDLPAKGAGQIDNQPDGMCLDAAGNLYVAHYGMRQVQVVSPEGKVIRRYPGGNLTTSNVAFGGPDMDTLYITGGIKGEGEGEGGLFRIKLAGVKGLKILPDGKMRVRRAGRRTKARAGGGTPGPRERETPAGQATDFDSPHRLAAVGGGPQEGVPAGATTGTPTTWWNPARDRSAGERNRW